MRVIAEVLDQGGQVLVLVPEIGLTPQTLARFRRRFGAAAALHSAASDNVRLATWMQCRSGDHRILIGTRSAVFAPFADLRLIIVDEEHDTSFKQQEGLRYSARDVALKRAQLLGIPTVLGSATPSLETLANVARGRYRRNVLKSRAGGALMPQFRVIDIRGRRLRDGLSDTLLHAIRRHLDAGNQVLIFINRRGFAPTCLCSACGWQARCADCDARLTLHESPRALHCHHCDRRYRYPDTCPDCGADTLVHLGTGTQRVDAALREHFPGIPLYRIDRDTARGPTRFAAQLDAIRQGEPPFSSVRRFWPRDTTCRRSRSSRWWTRTTASCHRISARQSEPRRTSCKWPGARGVPNVPAKSGFSRTTPTTRTSRPCWSTAMPALPRFRRPNVVRPDYRHTRRWPCFEPKARMPMRPSNCCGLRRTSSVEPGTAMGAKRWGTARGHPWKRPETTAGPG